MVRYKNNSGHKLVSAYLTWLGNLAQEFSVWKGRWGRVAVCQYLVVCCLHCQSTADPTLGLPRCLFSHWCYVQHGKWGGNLWLFQLAGEVMTNVSLLLFCPSCTAFPTLLFPSPIHSVVWFWLLHGGSFTESLCRVPTATWHWPADTTAVQVSINNMPRKAGSCQKQYVCAATICYSGYHLHLPRSARNNAPAQEDQRLLPREQFSHCSSALAPSPPVAIHAKRQWHCKLTLTWLLWSSRRSTAFCLHQQQGKPALGAAVGLLVCWQTTSFRCPSVAYRLFIMDKSPIFT